MNRSGFSRARLPKALVGMFGLFLVLVLVGGVVGPSYPWSSWTLGEDGQTAADIRAGLEEARAKAAQQRWGTADGLSPEADQAKGNWGMPESEQSKYPPPKFPAIGAGARNAAAVLSPPAAKAGFNSSTSEEIAERRGRTERVYRNADGTQTTEFSATPLNYQRPDGSWAPVDPTLVADGAGWRNAADQLGVRVANSAAADELVTVKLRGGTEFGYRLAGARPVAGAHAGSKITYTGVAEQTDLVLESLAGTVKETIVLRAATAPRSWQFPLRLKGLTAKVVDGDVVLTDAAGAEQARIPAGHMVDAAGAVSAAVGYRLVGQALEVTADPAWLADPARAYPVLVDPSVTEIRANTSMYVAGGSRVNAPSELRIGYNGVRNASYIAFGDIGTRLANHKVFGAALQVVNFDSTTCQATPLTVHEVSQAWGSSGGWPGPAFAGTPIAGASFSHGFIRLGQTRSACPAAGELIDFGVAGTDLVQRWANGAANHGITLRAHETNPSGFKKFTGTASANPPRLFITHSPYNARYAIDQPIPNPPVTSVQSGVVKIKVTNTGSGTWAPGTHAMAYKVFNADTGAHLGTEQNSGTLPTSVPPGATATVDATISARPPGNYVLDFTMRHNGVLFTDEQVAPARISLQVFNIPPVIGEQYPPSGHSVETLHPQLWARGQDHENDPLQYRFEVCEKSPQNTPVNCFSSARGDAPYWTLAGTELRWDKVYLWRAFAWDGHSESEALPFSALLTSVPQPEITSRLGTAPYTGNGLGFDPMAGNYTTAAIDAAAAVVGPELNVARTYNSLDPRSDLAFGVGWSTRYDMRVAPDADGSGNLVVTYPDGQQVRFGRNPDGSFTPPPGRFATLTEVPPAQSGGWKLVDKDRTVYQFRAEGPLRLITDSAGRAVELLYDGNGRLVQALSLASNRTLGFTWGPEGHITEVKTDPLNGTRLTWVYRYDADRLIEACDPTTQCTRYEYELGSHMRSAVLDSRPESYWRLGEPGGTEANSQIGVKLGKDKATYAGLLPTDFAYQDGVPTGPGDTGVRLNGAAHVKLPDRTVNKHRDLSIELWFRTGAAGPLVGYQDKAVGQTPGTGVPVLYVGQDGKLRGQFRTGSIAPITSVGVVNDNSWHHVVLTGSLATQTLYLDGVAVGTLSGVIDHSRLEFAQLGAAHVIGSWPSIGAGASTITASVDEVAFYSRPLGATAVQAHYRARLGGAQVTKVKLPSLRVAASITYDTANDRMREYVDSDGGRWQLGAPTVGGSETNIIRSVRVVDPGDRPQYYDFDGLKGRVLRQVTPIGTGPRPEDIVGRDCTTDSNGIVSCDGLVVSLGVRLFGYDESGFQTTVVDEDGNKVVLEHNDRGNLLTKTSCRTEGNCQSTHYEYQAPTADPTDPRTDKLIATRDPRSSGPTDNTYRTASEYTAFGDLAKETSPDGTFTTHAYTDGTSTAVGGGLEPARLLKSTTDPRGAVITNKYYANGDLAETIAASGLRTTYGYDALGRKTTETEFSDSFPAGLSTSYTYDVLGRVTEVRYPPVTNTISAQTKREKARTEYDADGNTTLAELIDESDASQTRTSRFEFDQFGRMTKAVGPEGNEASYGYDSFGNRTWAVDADGVKVLTTYTARNKVAQVRLVGYHGRAVTPGATEVPPLDPEQTVPDLVLEANQYDHSGRLVVQLDAMGRRTSFLYNGDGTVKEIRARADNQPQTADVVLQQNTYDAAGNLTQQVGVGGKLTTHEYDSTGRRTASTLEPSTLNRRTEYRYDPAGNITQVARFGAHSNTGAFSASFGEVVDFEYDLAGRQTAESLRGPQGPVTTRTSYDQRDLTTKVVAPRGNVAGAVAADHTTDYTHDSRGRVVSVASPPVLTERNGAAATLTRPTRTTGYNAFGDATEVRDALGNVVRTTYDKAGRSVRVESPSYLAPGASQPVVSALQVEYDGMGRAVKSTNGTGAISRNYYDQLGRVVERQDPDAVTPANPGGSWRYSYTHTGELLASTDPTGAETRTTYDQFRRPLTSTQIELRPTAANYETKYEYDAAGNLAKVTSPTNDVTTFGYDKLGQRTSATDAAGVTTQFGYDGFGNQVYQRDALGRASYTKLDQAGNKAQDVALNPAGQILAARRYTYDIAGNLLTAGDAYNKLTRFTYDALGNVTQRVEPVTDTTSITTSFGYDAEGNTTRFTDGRGNATIYTHNALGKPESVIEPSTPAHPNAADRTWTAAYDAASRPTSITQPGGVVRQVTYDGLGRMVRETGAGGGSATTPDRVLEYDAAGRTTKVSAPGSSNTYAYNNRGQLTSATGPSGDATFAYDGSGRLTSRVDASGTTGFTYTAGRLSSVQEGISGLGIAFGYTNAGELGTINYGSGRVRTFGYDDFGRETSDVTKNSGGATVASIGYEYDLNSRLTKKTTAGTANAGVQTYTYDQLGRTLSWTAGATTTNYTWDASGNRVQNGAKSAVYDQRNRVQSDGDYTYTYTARGTLASRTSSGFTENFTFDAFDRLVGVGAVSYTYDGLDRPVTRGGSTFKYAGSEMDPVSDGVSTYGRGAGGELLSLAQGADKRLLLSDKHGDVVGGFDPATALTSLPDSTAFDPFGKRTATTGTSRSVGYQGDWTDTSSGLVTMGARWYNPSTGSFVSRDTLTVGGPGSAGYNRYLYGVGSPLNGFDPTGHGWLSDLGHGLLDVAGMIPGVGEVADVINGA
ncbi:LamG-like jellyroll fold domain-containing protein [Actinokineospora globicatena]|uniref:LamG-like jellyroll fold domain-containing protein n=1 Tax=Actinokineospora globicatena TaxID=103729 RepID=UPI0020A5C2B8|nr:LamG-like jellyroll fold domain-containing protein [Actinokineospora globicatena]MCP2300633.1 RHS repeat-associated core domain-containing protein [Actinokineospora globicatena]GLW81177.1 hypothetical protein Aglo01_56580 [Actinokineospora globicatena]GLW88370.1 hypothetical protein Aglo02_60090 [Actinokineospora globicatena]